MAGQDYVPFLPGRAFSCVAAAAITAGQLVEITGGTLILGGANPVSIVGSPISGGVTPMVTPTGAATSAKCGVAAQTVASGAPVTVYFGGVHVLATAGTVSAGDPVTAAASGGVADFGASTTYDQIIGHAWSANSGGFVAIDLDTF
jgi:hypothetical protein